MSTDASSPAAVAAPPVEGLNGSPLVNRIVLATRPQSKDEVVRSKDYIGEFVARLLEDEHAVPNDVELNIKNWIGRIDQLLSVQLNEILHDPAFQELESTWRGLSYLVKNSETSDSLKIRVLNVNRHDLARDLEKAVEHDQSALFKKVYEEEYGQLGGEPYGVLIGNYEFGRQSEDITLLSNISNVAAAAHAPFVAAASPMLFNMDQFTELGRPRDLSKIFNTVEYLDWKTFRESDDSRYVALTLPRVLARLPYGKKFAKVDEFDFEEDVDGTDHSKYLWMNAAWAYTARLTDAYAKFGWLARTRGVETGGKVEDLPVHTFSTDDGDIAIKCPTEIAISDRREFELSELGFLPLIYKKGTKFAVFMGAQSCQKPTVYFEPDATANAELSAKFNLILCTSRFAHYLKVMARDKIGSFLEVTDCSIWLNRWILNYCVNPNGTGERIKAERPLSEASVLVREVAGKPGWYEAVAHLRPHFQLETLSTSLRLVAEVPKIA
jgi:type VI secretion system protein ImpC